jgi:hypothetical protein
MVSVDLAFELLAFEGIGASLSILGLRCARSWARFGVASAFSRYGVMVKTQGIERETQLVQGGPPVHCYRSVSKAELSALLTRKRFLWQKLQAL